MSFLNFFNFYSSYFRLSSEEVSDDFEMLELLEADLAGCALAATIFFNSEAFILGDFELLLLALLRLRLPMLGFLIGCSWMYWLDSSSTNILSLASVLIWWLPKCFASYSCSS